MENVNTVQQQDPRVLRAQDEENSILQQVQYEHLQNRVITLNILKHDLETRNADLESRIVSLEEEVTRLYAALAGEQADNEDTLKGTD